MLMLIMVMVTVKRKMVLKRMMGVKKEKLKIMIGGRSLEGILHKSFREEKWTGTARNIFHPSAPKALNHLPLVAPQVKRAQHLRSHQVQAANWFDIEAITLHG